jgi:hypothetical protein
VKHGLAPVYPAVYHYIANPGQLRGVLK